MWGGGRGERIDATIDLPVVIEPVSPMMSIVGGVSTPPGGGRTEDDSSLRARATLDSLFSCQPPPSVLVGMEFRPKGYKAEFAR